MRDTGSGIAVDEIDIVLRPFQRGSNVGTGDNGIGLGLALTRELMDSHGGQLRLESAVGQGTTVTLHFPDAMVFASLGTMTEPDVA
ncbi:MAG: ATP-binding protein [Minwuia sp.]|nr:ATP-binding protein [Minwuia sp.]